MDQLSLYLPTLLVVAAAPLAGVSAVTLGVVAATLLAWWHGRADLRDEVQEALFTRSPFPLWQRLVWLLIEGFWQSVALTLQGWHHLTRGSRRVWIDPAPGGTPVVLVAGYLENSGTLRVLARRLRARGFRVVQADFPNTLRRIEKNVASLREIVEQVRRETGAAKVAVVGHSMGGVIGRTLVQVDPCAPLDVVVTLGSPHRGTQMARYGPGPSARDMRPGSAHMLRYPHGRRCHVPVHTLVAWQENITSPAWASVLGEGEDVLLDAPAGHVGPLFLGRVADQVERWLLAAGVERVPAEAGVEVPAAPRVAA